MAIHNATGRTALLLVTDDSYGFTYPYGTWVQYRSRRLRPRVSTSPRWPTAHGAGRLALGADPCRPTHSGAAADRPQFPLPDSRHRGDRRPSPQRAAGVRLLRASRLNAPG